jgi:N-methylhydantoinase A/oxoprolinase/acetone carboxylase beta subunit
MRMRSPRRCQEVAMSASSQVLPECREYERFATMFNAYVGPWMRDYLRAEMIPPEPLPVEPVKRR